MRLVQVCAALGGATNNLQYQNNSNSRFSLFLAKISVLITFQRTRILHSSREAALAPSYDDFFAFEGHDFKIFYVGTEFLNVDAICRWWRWLRMRDSEAKLTIYADYVTNEMLPTRSDVEGVTIYEWCSGQLQEDLHGQGLTLLAYSNLGMRKRRINFG